jgi:hypothetical protein
MLEYPLKEAQDLLSTKLTAAKTSQDQVTEDLAYLKEQITTMEVNVARVYNYDVKLRRLEKEEKQKEKVSEKGSLSSVEEEGLKA